VEKEILAAMVNESLSIREITEKTSLGFSTIRYWLKKYNLKTHAKIKIQQIDCKFCSVSLEGTFSDFANHIRWCVENPERQKTLKAKAFETKLKELSSSKKRVCSDELRAKLSLKRKAWLAANPDKHPWKRSSKFESEPCQKLKRALKERSIEFLEEFTPLDERFFSIDISIPALKVGIEVNGEQHYNRDGSLKPYYRERHELIESAGWKLYEIHYSLCFDKTKVEQIVNSLILDHDLQQVDLTFEFNKKSKQNLQKFPTRQAFADSQKLSQDTLLQWKTAINAVDITKFGFIGKIAKRMNRSHTHVRRILNKYFPDIQTFKRKEKNSV
jgi:hypothetical protein